MTYHFGLLAPGKSSDLTVTLYVVAHHQLLCHAAVVKLYKETYKVYFFLFLYYYNTGVCTETSKAPGGFRFQKSLLTLTSCACNRSYKKD